MIVLNKDVFLTPMEGKFNDLLERTHYAFQRHDSHYLSVAWL